MPEGLKFAVTIPLLEKSTEIGESLAGATLDIQLVNGPYYEAIGTVFFGDKAFDVLISLRPASNFEIDQNQHLSGPAYNHELLKEFKPQHFFEGMDGTRYLAGSIKHWELKTCK